MVRIGMRRIVELFKKKFDEVKACIISIKELNQEDVYARLSVDWKDGKVNHWVFKSRLDAGHLGIDSGVLE